MAIVGLLAIFGLQYVWLVNTYKLAKESIQFRSKMLLCKNSSIAWRS